MNKFDELYEATKAPVNTEDLISEGKAGDPIYAWKKKKLEFLTKSLEKAEQKIGKIRESISKDFNGSITNASIIKSWKTGVVVRYLVTQYLQSNEILKAGDDISIVDEIKMIEAKIKSTAKKYKTKEFSSNVIDRPTVSGKQPNSVDGEFLIKMEI